MSRKTEDVIDVSSDDEPSPAAPKKKKPLPNAMVHIPQQLPGVTIKPIRTSPSSIQKALAGKPVTLTRVIPNPYANKIQPNGKQMHPQRTLSTAPMPIMHKAVVDGKVMRIQQILPNRIVPARVTNSKIDPRAAIKKIPAKFLLNPIRIQSPNTLNKLPPSITVTRTLATKRLGRPELSNVVKKRKILPKTNTGEVLTVELDDDEVSSSSTSSPQWYMRPEEQAEQEVKNNEEPEPTNFVEITIEDSPVKPSSKRAFEVGAELAITIDDSPNKSVATKNNASDSDEEHASTSTERHSKKKLEYPSGHKIGDTFEVEIVSINGTEPMAVDTITTAEKTGEVQTNDDNVVVIQESPTKSVENFQTSTPKKKKITKTQFKSDTEAEKKEDIVSGEFHPVYQSFIDLCFKLENSDDMKKIVEKKIKAYYKQVPKEYTESEEFIDMISSKITAMNAGPQKMYLYIKDVVDELNLQRKLSKSNPVNKETCTKEETEKFLYGEDSEFDSKRKRQIRKLEKTLKKLHRAIQKLEEQEVDFDDEEDSVYLLTESEDGSTSTKDINNPLERKAQLLLRYKDRMVRVHAKFCQLTNTKMPSELRVQIDARLGQPKGPAKRLEKWINKKVPMGTPLPFPDFHDVLRCVKDANEEDGLGWNDADIMDEARDLFTRCGKKLQRRRQENEWRLAASRIQSEMDPAENSEELRKKLEQNLQIASKRETEVFNKFADRQKQLKLEAVEIGDKEAEESPVESDDDEVKEDTTSLENKDKRKERLKRLLQEKSKKSSNVNTVQPDKRDESKASQPIVKIGMVKENEGSHAADETEKGVVLMNENCVKDNISTRDAEQCNDNEKPQSVSDDSNAVGSDIDELHLLQKLHSGNENATSTLESSDSETPIAISDTLDSGSDNKDQGQSDVISIENSSFSESEVKDDSNICEIESPSNPLIDTTNTNVEIEYSTDGIKKILNKSNNDEYDESIEDILLASSDEEVVADEDLNAKEVESTGNLKDCDIVVEETAILGENLKECEAMDKLTKYCKEKTIIKVTPEENTILSPSINDLAKNKSNKECIDNIDPISVESVLLGPEKDDNIASQENKPTSNVTTSKESLVYISTKTTKTEEQQLKSSKDASSVERIPLQDNKKNTEVCKIVSDENSEETPESLSNADTTSVPIPKEGSLEENSVIVLSEIDKIDDAGKQKGENTEDASSVESLRLEENTEATEVCNIVLDETSQETTESLSNEDVSLVPIQGQVGDKGIVEEIGSIQPESSEVITAMPIENVS